MSTFSEKLGYKVCKTEDMSDKLQLVYLEKNAEG